MISLLILTGCEANYNIEINDDYVKDELLIDNTDVTSWDKGDFTYREAFDSYRDYSIITDVNKATYTDNHRSNEDKTFYNKETINTNTNLGYHFNYKHNIKEYQNTALLKYSYRFVSVQNDNNKFVIDTGNNDGCTIFSKFSLLDKFNVNVTTDFIVNNHNADEVKDNVYTWHITKDNYKDKNIHIEINKNKKIEDLLKKEKYEKIIDIILVIIGVFLVIFAVRTTIKIRKTNN